MPEEMKGPEISQPRPEEAKPKGPTPEKPISEWGIGAVESRIDEIKKYLKAREGISEGEAAKLEPKIIELTERRKQLLAVGTREARTIKKLIERGVFKPEDIQEAYQRIEEIHPKGSELWLANVDCVLKAVETSKKKVEKEKVSSPKPQREAKVERVTGEPKKREEGIAKELLEKLDRIQAEIAEIDKKGKPLSKEKTEEYQKLTQESQKTLSQLSAFPGMEGTPSPITSVEKIGPEAYRKEFHGRITSLIEENIDQSFDANWRLVYPLEMAIAALRPAYGDSDVFKYEGEWFSYSKLRKELSRKLAAFRACHNHAYVHTRVGGVDALIEASHFLRFDSIEYLLNQPEITKVLRNFERLGEKYQEASSLKDEKERGKLQDELSIEMKSLIREDWRGIMAANLFSSLGETARFDVRSDRAGDFFMARIFHAKNRAELEWKTKWSREPYPDICEAADLKVYSFWMKVLTDFRGKLKNMDPSTYKAKTYEVEFENFCHNLGVEIKEGDIDKNGDVVNASLRNAHFGDLIAGRNKEGGYELGLPANELTLNHLDIADAENIRKSIFNPGGLLQKPNLGILTEKINEDFKHLKGKQRYEWFRKITLAIVNFYRDRVAPSIEYNFPQAARSSISKKFFPDAKPWTWEIIRAQVESMAPVLRKEDMDKVLDQTLGLAWRSRAYGKEVGTAVASGVLKGIGEFFKALFGMK